MIFEDFWGIVKIVGLKMAKIQGSDGQMDTRRIVILNIAFILNNFFDPTEAP
jgi:hypothetical protein